MFQTLGSAWGSTFLPSIAACCSSASTSAGMRSGTSLVRTIIGPSAAAIRPKVTQLERGLLEYSSRGSLPRKLLDLQSNERTQVRVRVQAIGHGLAHGFHTPECGSVTDIGFPFLLEPLHYGFYHLMEPDSHCASVANEDISQYMYDCESGPVVCTKKYGRNAEG